MGYHSDCRPKNLQVVGRLLAYLWIEHGVGGAANLTYQVGTNAGTRRLKVWVQDYTVFMACLLWSHVYGFRADEVADLWGTKLRATGQRVHAGIVREFGANARVPMPDKEGSMHMDDSVLSLLRIPG